MTETEYKVLKTAFDYDFIAVEMTSLDVLEQEAAMKLSKAGFVTMYGCDDSFVITDNGRSAVLRFEEQKQALEYHAKKEADQNAKDREKEIVKEVQERRKEKREARGSWLQFWLGLIVGWILGGFTFKEFVRFISGLFV